MLTGGELPALALADGISRLIPGVLSDDSCFEEESHFNGLLEYPQYTRPANWRGMQVPEVLLSGHHANIAKWRRQQSILRTVKHRPELIEQAKLDKKDKLFLSEICQSEPDFSKND